MHRRAQTRSGSRVIHIVGLPRRSFRMIDWNNVLGQMIAAGACATEHVTKYTCSQPESTGDKLRREVS